MNRLWEAGHVKLVISPGSSKIWWQVVVIYLDVHRNTWGLVGGLNHLEKHESQWEGLSHILCKKNVWNHQPEGLIHAISGISMGCAPLSNWNSKCMNYGAATGTITGAMSELYDSQPQSVRTYSAIFSWPVLQIWKRGSLCSNEGFAPPNFNVFCDR